MKILFLILIILSGASALTASPNLKDLGKEEIERMRSEVRIPLEDFIIPGIPILDANHTKVSRSSIEGKYLGVFISASWCGPCKYFARFLKKYTAENQDNFVVIFISLDRSKEAHYEYSQTINNLFFTLPYGHRPKRQLWDLSKKFWLTQTGIPVFMMYDPQGKCLGRKSAEIKDHVQGKRKYLPWVN